MSALAETFARCRTEKRAAFIPYLTAGDPDLETSGALLEALVAGGGDILELGVPFSDPIADGPGNQRAAAQALAAGTNLSAVLDLVARYRSRLDAPIVLFTYFNPIHRKGVEVFAEQAAASGVDGVLCVDLPPEEAAPEYIPAMRRRGLDTVFLLAPTSTRARIRLAAEYSTGFLYYVARTGVTGTREALPPALVKEARRVRRRVKMPLAVGFGISTPDQVAAVGKVADGVVVGSALVRKVADMAEHPDLPAVIEAETRRLAEALKRRR